MFNAIHTQGVLMSHANSRLSVYGRLLAVERVHAGQRVADVAAQLGCSRTTIYKWLARYASEGHAGLADRSSRPGRCPHRISASIERQILSLRRARRRGAGWIGGELGIAASTVGRVLARHEVPRLSELDALTGRPVRHGPASRVRYERDRPGELIHVDVTRLGRIPAGGGWRAHGRGAKPVSRRGAGFDFVHAAVDDHSRLVYAEIHPDEKGATCAGFLLRAAQFFAEHGIRRIERVMTDNAFNYRHAAIFAEALATLGARHIRIRPHCPWTNGKVERFNRTLQREWAYERIYISNAERSATLGGWLEHYNTERRHSALGNLPPVSRLSTM